MEEVKPLLRSFKNAVEIDFTDDNREKQILDVLGFKLWKKVEAGSQEALSELLATFNLNMTEALKTEITNEGTDVAYINRIKSFADVIKDKNVLQEGKKTATKTISADGLNQLNKIYNDVMKVAKHSANLFTEKKDAVNAEKFSYNKILAALTVSGKSAKKGGESEKPVEGEK
jgi:hypothetical protein